MPQFDGSSDAYWWLICIEKHFDVVGTQEGEKLLEAVKALRNRALVWWQWWSRCHLHASWRAFHIALLWHFKPEYRDVLPISDEEEESGLEWESSTPHTFSLQSEETDQGNSELIQTAEEKNEEKVENAEERDAENSSVNVIIVEKQQETKADLRKFLGIDRLFYEHGMGSVFESMAKFPRKTIGEGWVSLELGGLPPPPPKPPDPDVFVVKGGLSSGLIELALCLLLPKIPPQKRVFDACISYHVSHLALTLYFKLWDPGGHLCYPSP